MTKIRKILPKRVKNIEYKIPRLKLAWNGCALHKEYKALLNL